MQSLNVHIEENRAHSIRPPVNKIKWSRRYGAQTLAVLLCACVRACPRACVCMCVCVWRVCVFFPLSSHYREKWLWEGRSWARPGGRAGEGRGKEIHLRPADSMSPGEGARKVSVCCKGSAHYSQVQWVLNSSLSSLNFILLTIGATREPGAREPIPCCGGS